MLTPPCSEEEAQAQRGQVMCLRLHSLSLVMPGVCQSAHRALTPGSLSPLGMAASLCPQTQHWAL